MKKEGLVEYLHDNVKLRSRGYYERGVKVGEWKYFDEDGNFIHSNTFLGANASQILDEFYKAHEENKEES